MERRGRFIVFEGLDGSGVTTQAELLRSWLHKQGHEAILTKEPSDGPAGAIVRLSLAKRLASKPTTSVAEPLDAHALALLFAADRMDHIHNEILPRLRSGVVVVSDRYYLSSYAYQSLEVDLGWVKQINSKCIKPDLTLLIDVPAEICKKRMDRQRWHVELYEDVEKLARVRQNYLEIARDLLVAGEKIELIDGNQPANTVHSKVMKSIKRMLSKAPPVGTLEQLSFPGSA
jgi:dTMP kinase